MVRVICGRSDLGRAENGDKRCKISIKVDFRVIPSHINIIIDINAYMLVFINKITKFPDIPEKKLLSNFSGNSGFFGPETFACP